jgi:hypothetical protein
MCILSACPTDDDVPNRIDIPLSVTDLLTSLVRAYRFVWVGNDRTEIGSLGISERFVDIVAAGADAYMDVTSPVEIGKAWRRDRAVSYRVRDILDTLDRRAKASLSPISGEVVFTRHMLAIDCFLFRDVRDDLFICAQWGETATCLSDTVWIVPDRNLIIASPLGQFSEESIRKFTQSLYERIIRQDNLLVEYLSRQNVEICVTQPAIPHIGHYIWNGISGWSSLFRYCPVSKLPERFGSYGNISMPADVEDLYPESVKHGDEKVSFRDEEDAHNYCAKHASMVLTIKDEFVTQDLASRAHSWARRAVSSDFSARVKAFRAGCFPMVLATIRLDNRYWLEQKEGLISLFTALSSDFEDLGVVLDGINCDVTQGWTHQHMSLNDEAALSRAISAGCKDLPVFDSVGCTVAESLVLAETADCFVAPVGAGMAKYRWLANLPGIAFSNETFSKPDDYNGRLYDHYREQARVALHVAAERVTDFPPQQRGNPRANFQMDWRDLYEVVRPFLFDLAATRVR